MQKDHFKAENSSNLYRNYIGQGRNQKLFQQVIESFMPSHYALYIYVFYRIVHDNGMPSGKSSNIAVVQCINQSLQKKKQHLYINVDLLESSQIGVIFILCIYRVNHIVHRCHTCSLLLIQANAFENLFILKVFYVALQRYFVF